MRKPGNFLDGLVIPGEYSHSGVYVGDNIIIHAIAEGVLRVDLIDFCANCERVIVLRPDSGQVQAIHRVNKWLGEHYDFKFNSSDSSAFYCHELTATAYQELNIKTYPSKLFGMELPGITPKYLCDSFLTNEHFTIICEIKK